MRAFRSAPGGRAEVGTGALVLAYLAAWLLLPAVIAPVLIGAGELMGLASAGVEPGRVVLYLTAAVQFAMLVAWLGLLLTVPAVLLALAAGWFGWASAAAIGLIAGWVTGHLPFLPGPEIGAAYGVLALLGLWGMLRAARPRAFTPC